MSRFPLLLVALALVLPATSEATTVTCPQQNPYELTKVTDVTCGKARFVLKRYFSEQGAPGRWECEQKQYPGGVTTTCRDGARKIKHSSAD